MRVGLSRIRLLLVVDLELLRVALVSWLSGQEDIDVVAAVTGDDSVVEVATRLRPDVVVFDLLGPEGLSTIVELQVNQVRIVALAAAMPRGLVQALLDASVLGAVDKNSPAERLLEAIRGVAKGERVVDAELAVAAISAGPNPLTSREKEVLRLAADGLTGSQIADRLHLSPGTVRNYLSKALAKTSARTRVEAVRIAHEAGWI